MTHHRKRSLIDRRLEAGYFFSIVSVLTVAITDSWIGILSQKVKRDVI